MFILFERIKRQNPLDYQYNFQIYDRKMPKQPEKVHEVF